MEPPTGYHSVFGKFGHTTLNDYGYLKNNEFIVYSTGQAKMRYLVELDIR
jgi:hypothetical protein